MAGTFSLADYIDGFERAQVLCIGDIMVDRFVHGEVSRVSPEAPIPVVHVRREDEMLGGAGNVLRNISALGGNGRLISVVGDDAAGNVVRRLIADDARMADATIVEASRQTTIKTRYIAGGQQLLRADSETHAPISVNSENDILAAANKLIGQADIVVLSDYGKGVLTDAILTTVIRQAGKVRKQTIVDPKRSDYAPYAGATLIKPNVNELALASGMACNNDEQIVAAARALIDRHDFGAVLVSRSEHGASLIVKDRAPVHLPTAAREVFDVSGAGDTVVATAALAMAGGADLAAAARLANTAAGIVVGKVGTAVVRPDELSSALVAADVGPTEMKIVSRETALERVQRWRRRDLEIGFTNGCFDLLHPGHVSLLQQARDTCDRLIVGLNSDASVRRLKGEGRPVQGEVARAIVLASMEQVDLVVVFNEDTPLNLIETFRPNVLIKGADYSEDQVVGAAEVKRWGGRVSLAELKSGYSTTRTVQSLNGERRPASARGSGAA